MWNVYLPIIAVCGMHLSQYAVCEMHHSHHVS
jgi:hypothetical protein